MSCGGGHLGFPIGIKNTHLVEDLPMIIPGQFGFNYPSGLLRNYKYYYSQTVHECSLDGPLQTTFFVPI
jgi:hypothetical protein